MLFSVVSIFPQIVKDVFSQGLMAKAQERGLIKIEYYDLREFTSNKHKKVDDRPFGGGAGMVMMPEPFFKVVEHIKKKKNGFVVLFSAYGKIWQQKLVENYFVNHDHLILLCPRYEGVDQRVIDNIVDEEISIGKFVLMGGEIPATVLIESISRMIPNVLGNKESLETDSFFKDEQIGYPQYTQPRDYKGLKVPNILLEGHHLKIQKWRHEMSQKKIIK